MMRDALERTPVLIVTGFLGTGKTTLLNHLLTSGGLGRVAALVNDFGAIDIDAAIIAEVADEVVQLANGCICCTINGDLLAGAQRVLALKPPIDLILVETTGLADPLPVGLTFLQTELRRRTGLEAVVTVVDCANFSLDLFKADAAMAQIVHADLIVLNKIDLVRPEEVALLARRVALIKPQARILETCHARVPLAAIVDTSRARPLMAAEFGHSHRHLLEDGFVAHAYRLEGALAPDRFQYFLDRRLPSGVFRAKGIVALSGMTRSYLFQLCGKRVNFEPYDGPVNETRIVFIGRNLEEKVLADALEACLER
jgi:G3E family GTPase